MIGLILIFMMPFLYAGGLLVGLLFIGIMAKASSSYHEPTWWLFFISEVIILFVFPFLWIAPGYFVALGFPHAKSFGALCILLSPLLVLLSATSIASTLTQMVWSFRMDRRLLWIPLAIITGAVTIRYGFAFAVWAMHGVPMDMVLAD